MEKIIQTLVASGYEILFIPQLNKIFIVNEFDPSFTLGQGETGFNRVKGIEISSLLPQVAGDLPMPTLKAKLNSFVESSPVMNLKFHKDYLWQIYVR